MVLITGLGLIIKDQHGTVVCQLAKETLYMHVDPIFLLKLWARYIISPAPLLIHID